MPAISLCVPVTHINSVPEGLAGACDTSPLSRGGGVSERYCLWHLGVRQSPSTISEVKV